MKTWQVLIWILSGIVAAFVIGTKIDTPLDYVLLTYILGSIWLGIKMERRASDIWFEKRCQEENREVEYRRLHTPN